jgi:hypothetical protein
MTPPILCIAALKISGPSGPEVAEVCLPSSDKTLNRAVEPLSSNRLASNRESYEYFSHNRDAATPNFSVKPTPGRLPRAGLKPPRISRDARRHAACNRVKRQSAAAGVPLCPPARGASARLTLSTLGGRTTVHAVARFP